MSHWLERSRRILGAEAIEALSRSRVAVLGLGGVGSAAAEAICRAGVGHMLVVDQDQVEMTNLNRQLIATTANLGQDKCQAVADRLRSIHPQLDIQPVRERYLPENFQFLFDFQPDFVIDAIDMVTAKLHLVQKCRELSVPLITCLGTGNRLDPSQLRVGDLSETQGCGCPLARVMRRELKKAGIFSLPVVYSTEFPRAVIDPPPAENGRHSPGSTPFVPPCAGYLMASYVTRQLLNLS